MRIQDYNHLKVGKTYYLFSLFVNTYYRVERIGKIQKITFIGTEDFVTLCGSIRREFKAKLENGKVICLYYWRHSIFDNFEEAKEEYNKKLQLEIDSLDNFYQTRKSKLESLKYK